MKVGKLNLSLNCNEPQFFVSCQWQEDKCKPNLRYLIYRWIIAIYFNFVVVLSFITASDCKQLDFYAIYLTNWNVILNGISSLMAAILVTLFYRHHFTFDRDPDNTTTTMNSTLKTFWILSTLSTVISISLCLVYWPFIYVGRDDGLNDTLTHGGNAVVNFIDLFIHAHPARFGHVVYVFSAGVFYLIFSIIYTLAGGTDRDYKNFIYSVIDWKGNTINAIIFAVGTIIFLSVVHFILTGLIKLRILIHSTICEKKSGSNGKGVDNLQFSA